ncbi:hypothetical protein KP509_21G063800 [Ceratopteris richardii]|uniref:Uncharacterized protein n=1 Tax=Ceratopteris richardii TaxID=49495 RepID=A0A8T2SCI3_CERRI|nr:hypothetical protein KP509_21G063800 [Ceratopteris richardii]
MPMSLDDEEEPWRTPAWLYPSILIAMADVLFYHFRVLSGKDFSKGVKPLFASSLPVRFFPVISTKVSGSPLPGDSYRCRLLSLSLSLSLRQINGPSLRSHMENEHTQCTRLTYNICTTSDLCFYHAYDHGYLCLLQQVPKSVTTENATNNDEDLLDKL